MNYEVREIEAMCVEEGFSDLRARTRTFALRIIKLFSSLPKSTEAQVLGKQLLRSGTSVGANYREAYRSRSDADGARQRGDGVVKQSATAQDIVEGEHCRVPFGRQCEQFISKLGDCLKELDESSYWMELLIEAEIVKKERLTNLLDENNQLIAIFTTIAKKVKARKKRPTS